MTTIGPSPIIPYPTDPLMFSRNERIVPAAVGRRICGDLNHVVAHSRKWIASYAIDLQNPPTAQSNTIRIWRGYCRTGEEGSNLRLRFRTLVGPAGNASASNPRCYWEVIKVGGATTNSATIYTPLYVASYGPDDLHLAQVDVDVDPDSAYSYALVVDNYALPLAASIHERNADIYDSADGTSFPSYNAVVGGPVTYQDHAAMRDTAHEVWKHNGSHLFSWAANCDPSVAGTVPSRTTNSYANAFDQSKTTFNAIDPGFKMQARYHSPAHDAANVPCVFAAYAQDSGTGTLGVRLLDSNGTLVTLTGFSVAGSWVTGTFNAVGNTDLHNVQIYITGDGTNTVKLWAATAYEYST